MTASRAMQYREAVLIPMEPCNKCKNVNVNSTGYGLFVAKTVIDGHDGKIWVESEGAGKGSRFVVDFGAGFGV